MTELIAIKDKIRNGFRKYDEFLTPVFRFIFAFLVFYSVKEMFGYFELANRMDVRLLLSVMAALLPDGFLFFVVGVIITAHCFSVSIEVGMAFLLLFMVMYCVYIRLFPKCGFALMLTLVCYTLHLEFAVPFIVAILAGFSGAVPAALGVAVYYFAGYTADVNRLMPKTTASDLITHITSGGEEEQMDALQYLIDMMLHNKEMFLIMGVFILTILVIGVIYRLSFKYSWFVAFAAGIFAGLFSYIYMCYILGFDADISSAMKGLLTGFVVALIIRFFKGFLDYEHTEKVQFEDDDYFYYVKAVPKLAAEKKPVVDFSKVNGRERRKPARKTYTADDADLGEKKVAEKDEKAEKTDRTDKTDKPDKAYRTDKAEQKSGNNNPNRSNKNQGNKKKN